MGNSQEGHGNRPGKLSEEVDRRSRSGSLEPVKARTRNREFTHTNPISSTKLPADSPTPFAVNQLEEENPHCLSRGDGMESYSVSPAEAGPQSRRGLLYARITKRTRFLVRRSGRLRPDSHTTMETRNCANEPNFRRPLRWPTIPGGFLSDRKTGERFERC